MGWGPGEISNGCTIHECGGLRPSPSWTGPPAVVGLHDSGVGEGPLVIRPSGSPVSCPHWPFEGELLPAMPGVDNPSPTPNPLVQPQPWPSGASLSEATFLGAAGGQGKGRLHLECPPLSKAPALPTRSWCKPEPSPLLNHFHPFLKPEGMRPGLGCRGARCPRLQDLQALWKERQGRERRLSFPDSSRTARTQIIITTPYFHLCLPACLNQGRSYPSTNK